MHDCNFSIVHILNLNVCAISFNSYQDLLYRKNSGIIETTAPPSKLSSQNLYECHLSKEVYCMQNYVRFYAMESKKGLSQEFRDK